MENVKETLIEFVDDKFFNSLFEAETETNVEVEEDTEMTPAEKQKLANQKQKEGMAVIKKCQANWKAFKIDAKNMWQEYRDFWSTQEDAIKTIKQKGLFYNLYKSDYIVGVVKNAAGMAELKVYNTSHTDLSELETFVCKNPEVIQAFNSFYKAELQGAMREVISSHKEAMEAKKKADKLKAKEDKEAQKRAKLDAFLGEEEIEEELYSLLEELREAGDVESLEKILTEHVLLERQFTSEQRDKFASSGIAMSNGSYPIEDKSDLKNAIRAVGRAKNPDAVKAHIKKRANALGAKDLIPKTW